MKKYSFQKSGPFVKQRSFNVEMGFFGVPETGKTDKAVGTILDIKKELNGHVYIICHDSGYSVPKKLHDGRLTGVVRYDSVEECRAALIDNPGGFHCIRTADAAEVVEFGKELGELSLVKNSPGGIQQVEDGEGRGIPVIIYIDEVVRAQQASPHRLGNEMAEILACRRHYNCGFIFTCQSPHLCHYALGSMATDIVFFNLQDEDDVKRMYKRMGVPREEAEKALHLSIDKHEYIHISQRKVVSSNKK